MPSLKELREQAGEKLDAIKKFKADHDQRKKDGKTGTDLWPDETRSAWETVNKEYDELRSQIDDEKRSEELDQRIGELEQHGGVKPGQDDTPLPGDQRSNGGQNGPTTAESRALALQAFCGRGHIDFTKEHAEACQRMGVDPNKNKMQFNLMQGSSHRSLQLQARNIHHSQLEERALSAHLGSAGGFTIQEGFISQLEVNMLAFGGVGQVAQIMTTDSGERTGWPTADDTTNEGGMIGENEAIASDEDPTFGAVYWDAYEFTSKIIKVPNAFFEDSAINVATELANMIGERIGRAGNRKFTTGTGDNQPKGIVTCAGLGKTATSATALTAAEIIELEHSIDPAYRSDPSFGFMLHDSVLMYIRLLNDSDGRPLWASNIREGRPDTLHGRQLTINQHMDSAVAASNKTILCGQFSKYKIRRVRQLVLKRLDERFADSNQTGFLGILRQDGNLLDAGTKPIKYLQQAAS